MSPTEAQAPGRRQMAVSDLGQVVQRRDAPLGQPIPPRLDTLEPAIDVAEHDPPGVGCPRAVDALQHQLQGEAQLQLGDDHDRGPSAAHRDDVAAADLPLHLEALPLQEHLDSVVERGLGLAGGVKRHSAIQSESASGRMVTTTTAALGPLTALKHPWRRRPGHAADPDARLPR